MSTGWATAAWLSSLLLTVPVGVACGRVGHETRAQGSASPAMLSSAVPAAVPSPHPAASSMAGTPSSSSVRAPRVAIASIEPRSGSTVKGTVTLTLQPGGVQVFVEVQDAPPGEHGIHFHEKADCSAQDATSAGGHWNPDHHPHALPPTTPRHLGDMGNLEVGKNGRGRLAFFLPGANLVPGDVHSLIGRALIIHQKRDDGSQPTGNSGARIACAAVLG